MKFFFYVAKSLAKPFLLLVVLAFPTELYAQPAASLSVQGVLTRTDGTAVDDGNYSVTFKLFDAPGGGNEVHSELIDVETVGGVYRGHTLFPHWCRKAGSPRSRTYWHWWP